MIVTFAADQEGAVLLVGLRLSFVACDILFDLLDQVVFVLLFLEAGRRIVAGKVRRPLVISLFVLFENGPCVVHGR